MKAMLGEVRTQFAQRYGNVCKALPLLLGRRITILENGLSLVPEDGLPQDVIYALPALGLSCFVFRKFRNDARTSNVPQEGTLLGQL